LNNANATILVVDDEPVNLDTICSHLQHDDYELLRAGNGLEAWTMIDSDPELFDVIILDRSMPDISAMQLLNHIRQHDAMEQVPVVMQTTTRENRDVAEGMRAGAYYYLTKPYDRDTLKTVVRSAVDGRLHEKSLQQSLRAGRKIFELMSFGRLRIHNLQECNLVASQVAHLCPDPQRVVSGISELLLNALEHGNLNIGYRQKSRLMRSGQWHSEIERRLGSDTSAFVELEFDVNPERIQIRVRDQGEGFDWRPYLDFDPARAFDPHGRGIAVARSSSFDELEYIGKGNEVLATVSKRPPG
jgi:DNA-binding response OmpR family regulator